MLPALAQITPVFIKVVDKPTRPLSVLDILLGGFGLVGIILLGALLVGIILGGGFIFLKHRLPQNSLNGQASQTHGLKLTSLMK